MNNIPDIYLAYVAIAIGFVGLVWSADRFVIGAASIATNLGVTPIVIGLTIVSLGTSAPEILVSINASLSGAGDLAVGNALGSNIANIGLVLGVTLLITRITVQKHLLIDELPTLLIISILAGIFLFDARISQAEGWILLLLLPVVLVYVIYRKKHELATTDLNENDIVNPDDIPELSPAMSYFWFAIGLALLIVSSKILVWGGETTAVHFGVSPLIIGLTVIAVGTSLPELAASVMSAIKGHHDIALGNIIGSNIFNLLAVMSLPGIINPQTMDASVFSRDYMFMLGFTVLVFVSVFAALTLRARKIKAASTPIPSIAPATQGQTTPQSTSPASIGKITGMILIIIYILYYVILFVRP